MPDAAPEPPGSGGAPTIPGARRPRDETDDVQGARAAVGPTASRPGRRTWRQRGWDIPWLGGRSTAPWVVLATVLILVLAAAGTIYANVQPDKLGYVTKRVQPISDTAVLFTFDVYKAPKAVAACTVLAADEQGGVGILRDTPIPARADGAQNSEITVTVPTIRRASNVVLDSCHIVRSG